MILEGKAVRKLTATPCRAGVMSGFVIPGASLALAAKPSLGREDRIQGRERRFRFPLDQTPHGIIYRCDSPDGPRVPTCRLWAKRLCQQAPEPLGFHWANLWAPRNPGGNTAPAGRKRTILPAQRGSASKRRKHLRCRTARHRPAAERVTRPAPSDAHRACRPTSHRASRCRGPRLSDSSSSDASRSSP